MTTQVRPLVGGPWFTISQDALNVVRKTTNFGLPLPSAWLNTALRCLNEWVNCRGTGTASVRAQGTINAIGIQIQEI